ncbi:MAG: HAD-IG family 5'-nucleotidase [Acidimicrobiia bacterium]
MSGALGPERGVFVNRTLNLRSIKAVGYDLDYTLVHYDAARWEERAFEHAKRRLGDEGWPVSALRFDAKTVIRGLAIDLATGNLVKATRFGYVIRAAHGTRFLGYDEIRTTYADTLVDLGADRFVFINVLFSLSEASLYSQLVEVIDAGDGPAGVGYAGLYAAVRTALGGAHREGDIRQDILADLDRFVVRDPDTVLALLDQRHAGKCLLLITNSDWSYADRIMTHAFDPFLPSGTWRDVFDAIVVSADKPSFFTSDNALFKVIDEEHSLLSPHFGTIDQQSVFYGGCARRVETSLGLSGDEILYVGDHLFGDVHFSKALLSWRTLLILRELETEVSSAIEFKPTQRRLVELMSRKQQLEAEIGRLTLAQQRANKGYVTGVVAPETASLQAARSAISELDDEIAPLAVAAGAIRNEAWGPLMRAGIDKSLFARQVERYADAYASRVSNLLAPGPHAMLRAQRVDLPHDAAIAAGPGRAPD